MGEYLLEVNHLSKYYKARGKGLAHANQLLRAVDDVSFKLRRGEVLGVVGESGCGKSTMGNTIIRLLEPDNGEIIFEGHDLAKMNQHELRKYRADIQMIFQDPFSSLDPRMHVFDIIAEPLRVHHTVSGKELEDRVLNLMEVVGLDAILMSSLEAKGNVLALPGHLPCSPNLSSATNLFLHWMFPFRHRF